MTFVPPAPVEKITSRIHRWIYRRTNGRFGGTVGLDKRPVALLTTTGRKTGVRREWPVLCLADGDRHVVVASNAGRDRDPAWMINLRAEPHAELQVGDERFGVVAREADVAEAEQLWPRLHDMYEGYADHQRSTSRPLPVVILERTRSSAH